MRRSIIAKAAFVVALSVGSTSASDRMDETVRSDRTVHLVNQERASRGLPALRRSPRLDAAARSHVDWMTRTGRVSHTGKRGTRVQNRARDMGYEPCYAGETIAYGPPTQEIVVRAWMNSPSHKRVIVSRKAGEIGVAAARDAKGHPYWVMVTGRRCG